MPQLGWTAQADGYIDYYNRGWFDYTGTTLEQMEGWGWQSVHDPELVDGITELWQASIATGQTSSSSSRSAATTASSAGFSPGRGRFATARGTSSAGSGSTRTWTTSAPPARSALEMTEQSKDVERALTEIQDARGRGRAAGLRARGRARAAPPGPSPISEADRP